MANGDRTRRQFLRATGAAATAAIAGCSGTEDGDDTTRRAADRASTAPTTAPTEGPGTTTTTTGGETDTTADPPAGNELTAADVVYSFRRLAESDHSNQSERLPGLLGVTHEADGDGGAVPGTLGVEAVDTHEVRITLEEPFAPALSVLAHPAFSVVPEGIVGDVPGYDGRLDYETFAYGRPVGSGPFAFEEWRPGESVSVDRFEGYHGDRPRVAGVDWAVVGDRDTRFERFLAGAVDVGEVPADRYDPSKVTIDRADDRGRRIGTYGPLANGETVGYARIPQLSTFYVGFNCERVPLPVRRAVAHVFDAEAFAADVYRGRWRPAYHLTPPSVFPGGPDAYEAHYRGEDGGEGYPYGVGGSDVAAARRVMENAGYGPDDRYELGLLGDSHRRAAYEEVAEALRSRLAGAHVDVDVGSFQFETLNRLREGDVDAFTLGWTADYPSPESFLGLVDPPRTNYDRDDATGAYLYWTEDSYHGEGRRRAVDAFERIEDNPEPSEAARRTRNEAYRDVEAAVWTDVPLICDTHGTWEPVWHDRVDWPLYGALGPSGQRKTAFSVSGRDRLRLHADRVTTLDPVASVDEAGQRVITQVFDTLTTFRNGTTAVEPLLATGIETGEDFTEYRIRLKEGVRFHPEPE